MGPPPKLAELLDRGVIAWILDGNAEAYRELRRRYEDRVYASILRLVADPDEADDLTQQTFIKAYENLAGFKPESPFAPWILKIAKNTTMDRFREERREARARQVWLHETTPGRRLMEGIPAIDQSSSNPPINAYRLRLAFALACEEVNRTYLDCFLLRYGEKQSYAEIAGKLHLTPATARSYAHRAQKQLEEMLGELRDYLLQSEITPA